MNLSKEDIRQIRICLEHRMSYWEKMLKDPNKEQNTDIDRKLGEAKNLDNLSVNLMRGDEDDEGID